MPEAGHVGPRAKTALALLALVATVAGVRFGLQATDPGSALPQSAYAQIIRTKPGSTSDGRTYKILHVMSHHKPWDWPEEQFRGFKEGLRGLDVTYRVVDMEPEGESDPLRIEQVAHQAIQEIDAWAPDLVFTGADDAQRYVTLHYSNSGIPFVFCAVNAEPSFYGFDEAENVTGVIERAHFVQAVELLRQLVPSVRTIALITDASKPWATIIEQLKQQERQLDGVQVVAYDVLDTYEEYQQSVLVYQDRVDALGFLGISEFRDRHGNPVPMETVIRWTVKNSRLPDFTFWKDRVAKGVLCAVTMSDLAQGQAAGQIARGILVEGRRASEYPVQSTNKGMPVINLARAKRLRITPTSTLLLTADVVHKIYSEETP